MTRSNDPAEVAVRALARRDLSRAALERRLEAAGVPHGLREATLDRLAEAGLVDDRRLAESRAAALAARGFGDAAIEARLEAEEVGREDRAEALARLEPEESRARRLAEQAGPARLRNLASSLARRGFADDAIDAALAAVDGSPGAQLG